MPDARSDATPDPASLRVLVMTCPPDQAERLLEVLLRERLVACGNVLAAQSRYRWQGELCREPEALVIMETATGRVAAAMARLAELHPYKVPKLLAFAPTDALAAYVAWVLDATTAAP